MRTLASDLSEEDRTALADALTVPDVALYMAAAAQSASRQGLDTALPETQDLDTAAQMFTAATAAPGFDSQALLSAMSDKVGDLDETMASTLDSQAIQLVGWNTRPRAWQTACRCTICCGPAARCC